MSVEVLTLTGSALRSALPALADLRIRVFSQWPYLYDGDLAYERKYLEKFSASHDALIVVAHDGERIIGASTASPLLGNADEFVQPFRERGCDLQHIFYFGESVLLPEFRGQGVGHAFFEAREKHARQLGSYHTATFCGVIRDPNDPRKPADYHGLESLWRKHGFEEAKGITTTLGWKEIEHDQERKHDMQFWIKRL